MEYDIRNVGYYYLMAEDFRKNGEIEKAIEHYQLAIDNYERADNEYILDPLKSYKVAEADGKTYTYPSVSDMVDDSCRMIQKLKEPERQRDLEQRLQKAKDGNTKQILIVIAIALVILVVSHMI